jgi:hypothetical protein
VRKQSGKPGCVFAGSVALHRLTTGDFLAVHRFVVGSSPTRGLELEGYETLRRVPGWWTRAGPLRHRGAGTFPSNSSN